MPSVHLRMPTVDFETLENAEIWFMEEGILRRLNAEEWKSYFPGCDYPIAMRRRATGTEEVWRCHFNVNMMYDAQIHGFRAAIFGVPAEGEKAADKIPPLTLALSRLPRHHGGLIRFVTDYQQACARWPDATVSFVWA